MPAKKTRLVKTWKVGALDVRLVAEDNVYNQYARDAIKYTLEKDVKDSLGDPKWVPVHEWFSNDTDDTSAALNALVKLVEQLIKQLPVAVPPGVPDPVGVPGVRY
jgi:hypothetical protein